MPTSPMNLRSPYGRTTTACSTSSRSRASLQRTRSRCWLATWLCSCTRLAVTAGALRGSDLYNALGRAGWPHPAARPSHCALEALRCVVGGATMTTLGGTRTPLRMANCGNPRARRTGFSHRVGALWVGALALRWPRSYATRPACADLCREWGTPPEGPPIPLQAPSRLLSNHKTLHENHSIAVYPLALLGTTISVSLSRCAPRSPPPRMSAPAFLLLCPAPMP